jgi:hypothetical protein
LICTSFSKQERRGFTRQYTVIQRTGQREPLNAYQYSAQLLSRLSRILIQQPTDNCH